MRKLFICEYPYVLYKILVKAIKNKTDQYDIIISNRLENMVPMLSVLKERNIFKNVYFFDSKPYEKYYSYVFPQGKNNIVLEKLNLLKNYIVLTLWQRKFKEIEMPVGVEFKEYDEIYCTDLAHVINGYLATNCIPFGLIEHAKDVFGKENYGLIENIIHSTQTIMDKCNIVTGMRTGTKYCTYIEVNKNQQLAYFTKYKKIKEWKIDEEIVSLSAEQKNEIFKIYAEAYGLQLECDKEYNLLLTNPLYNDGFVESEELQIKFYKYIVKEYLGEDTKLIIKAHPRDKVNYIKAFPEAIVINNSISSEVLNFSKDLQINKVVTFYSTSAAAFKEKANKVITIEESVNKARNSELLKRYL